MFYKRLCASMFSLFAVTAVQARGLDISLGNDAAQITYLYNSDSQIGIGGTDLGLGFFFNEAEDVLINGGILVTGSSLGRNRAIQLGAGVRGYAGILEEADDDNDTVSSIGIGGKIGYILPSRTPMTFSFEGYIAPDVTSFGDNEKFTELLVRFEVEIAPTTRFIVGYRHMEVEFEDVPGDYELDDSGHVGIRFSF